MLDEIDHMMEQNAEFIGHKVGLDAKRNNTYVVYRDDHGDFVREYPDGTIIKIDNLLK